jgi:hypothetical protein
MGCPNLTYRENPTPLKVVYNALNNNEKGSADEYRYSFNGQEQERELNPSITSALYWMYDGRTIRRWNRDPVFVAWESPYASFRNNPIRYNDPDGDIANGLTAVGGLFLFGGVELGGQLVGNGFNLKKVDWVDVGVESLKGAAYGSGFVPPGSLEFVSSGIKASVDISIDEQTYIFGKDDHKKYFSDVAIDLAVDYGGGKLLDNSISKNVSDKIDDVINIKLTDDVVAKQTKIVNKETALLEKQVAKDPNMVKQSSNSTQNRLNAATDKLKSAEGVQAQKQATKGTAMTTVKTVLEGVENKVSQGFKWLKNKVFGGDEK